MEFDEVEREYVAGAVRATLAELDRTVEKILLDPVGQVARLNALRARAILRSALTKLELGPARGEKIFPS